MERKEFVLTTLAAMPALAFISLNGGNQQNGKPFVVRSGDSRFDKPMKYRGIHPNDIIISGKDTANELSIFAFTGYAKVGPSYHVHFDQDEIFYVVEGSYRFVVGEETMELYPGDTIFLPRKIPHSWIQLTDKGRLIYALQPAGTFEDFLIEMDELKAPPTEEESQTIHKKHGMEVVGPPLSL